MMAFGCHIRLLPSVFSYTQAEDAWKRAPVAKTTAQYNKGWSEDRRPLDDFRKTHYAVERVSRNGRFEYDFYLFKTRVVCWRGLSTITVNPDWDSTATNNFLYQFTGVVSVKHCNHYLLGQQRVVVVNDKHYIADGDMTFEKKGDIWEPAETYPVPEREVLHPDGKAAVLKGLRGFSQWLRAIHAMSPPEQQDSPMAWYRPPAWRHPWVGQEDTPAPEFERMQAEDMDAFVAAVVRFSAKSSLLYTQGMKLTCTAAPTDVEEILANTRNYYYKDQDAYIRLKYNEPIPKRRK
jgi:hypothetical protein